MVMSLNHWQLGPYLSNMAYPGERKNSPQYWNQGFYLWASGRPHVASEFVNLLRPNMTQKYNFVYSLQNILFFSFPFLTWDLQQLTLFRPGGSLRTPPPSQRFLPITLRAFELIPSNLVTFLKFSGKVGEIKKISKLATMITWFEYD